MTKASRIIRECVLGAAIGVVVLGALCAVGAVVFNAVLGGGAG